MRIDSWRPFQRSLPHRSFHLQFDESVHLNGVFHGEFFHEWLDESADDHRAGFGLRETTALQIEQLLLAYLGHARLVANRDILLLNFNVRIRVTATFVVQNQGVADDAGPAFLCARLHSHQPAVAGAATIL